MADRKRKFSLNSPGRWYVDQECIDCNLCSEIAPDHFKVNMEEGHDYVYQQPQTEAQESLCLEALQACPVEAIGNDEVY